MKTLNIRSIVKKTRYSFPIFSSILINELLEFFILLISPPPLFQRNPINAIINVVYLCYFVKHLINQIFRGVWFILIIRFLIVKLFKAGYDGLFMCFGYGFECLGGIDDLIIIDGVLSGNFVIEVGYGVIGSHVY